MGDNGDILSRDQMFAEEMFPRVGLLDLGDRRQHTGYNDACNLVSSIRDKFKNFRYDINLQNSGNPKGTATAITEGSGRTGNVDHDKVKLHLTGELLADVNLVNSFDTEINTNNNAKLQYFLFFNMFEDEHEHCAVLRRLASKKGILRHGITAKEAEIIIYVAKEEEVRENITYIMPYFDKKSLIDLVMDVATMLVERNYEDMYQKDKEYFINCVEATYQRLSSNN